MHRVDWVSRSTEIVRDSRFVLRAMQPNTVNFPRDSAQLDGILEAADADDILKDDRTTTVSKVVIDGQSLILKRYNARNHWHTVKRAFRKSRARRCWKMSFEFKRAGLNVSEPVMMFEDRYILVRKDAYFANRLLSGDELLTKLPDMSEPEKQQVKAAIFQAFKTMAQAKISHGDMKATNLLWVDQQLYFIDLDAAKKHAHWSPMWSKAHTKDKKRFLKNWDTQPELLTLFSDLTAD